jgi:galactokinase
MDQYATFLCKKDHALLIDCRDRSYRHVTLHVRPYRFILINSMVKHDIAEGAYNRRRSECESALAVLRETHPLMKDLRACTPEMLADARKRLSEIEYLRVAHQVGENERVLAAEKALNFEVSSPEQDFLVDAAMRLHGVLGARMTGGGFGGNVICLVHQDRCEALRQSVGVGYLERFGKSPEFRICSPEDGAVFLGVDAS